MTKIIVNADDFGLSEAVNYGIISAYKNGIVRSTTIMPGMPAFEHAIGLLKENNADISNVEVRDYQLGTGDAGYNTQHKGSDSAPLTISAILLNVSKSL